MCPAVEALGFLGSLGKTFPSTVVGSGEYLLLPTSTITMDNDGSQGPACWPPLHPSSLQPPDPGTPEACGAQAQDPRDSAGLVEAEVPRIPRENHKPHWEAVCSPTPSPTSMPQTPGSLTAPSRGGGLPSTKVGQPFSQTQVPTALLSAEGQQGPRTSFQSSTESRDSPPENMAWSHGKSKGSKRTSTLQIRRGLGLLPWRWGTMKWLFPLKQGLGPEAGVGGVWQGLGRGWKGEG